MSQTFSERTVTVDVVVELASTLVSLADLPEQQVELHDRLFGYIERLTTDLRLPLKISLTIEKLTPDLDRQSCRIKIDGQLCRIPIFPPLFQAADPLALAAEVAEVICQNRQLFLTPPLIQTINRDLMGEDWGADSLSSETLRQVLLESIDRGFGIHRCLDLFRSAKDRKFDNFNAANLFEQAIASLDCLSISVWTKISCLQIDPEVARSDSSSLLSNEKLRLMQEELFYELGLLFPLVQIQQPHDFRDDELQIQLNDLRFPAIFGVAPERVIEIVKSKIRKNAGAFLNTEIWQYYLTLLQPLFPILVDAVANKLDTTLVIRTLRNLLDEEISIQNLPTILESLLAINGSTTIDRSKYIMFFSNTDSPLSVAIQPGSDSKKDINSIAYANAVRASLKRYISYKYTRGSSTLTVYLLDPDLEARIQDIEARPLQIEERDRLLDAISKKVNFSATQAPTILTAVETRKRLRQSIEVEFPELFVLGFQELSPDLNIRTLDRISLL